VNTISAIVASRHTVAVLAAVWTLFTGVDLSSAGAIQGAVTLQGPAPTPRKLPITIDQYVCGESKDAGDLQVSAKNGIRNVVAWIENPPPGSAGPAANPAVASHAEAPAGVVEMDQKACVFTPRVVLVPAGGTVNFLNSDRLLHNLRGRPRLNGSFNRTQPKGRPIAISFAQPEIFRVDCDLHSWMRSWVVVTEHPFYAVSDADGRFTLDRLPSGRYKLRLWHETLGTASREVMVSATGATPVAIEMARPPSQ
jgi:plastocyanin